MDIKSLIKQKRLEKGLTIMQLAKLVGVSHATISRWETGRIADMKQSKIALLAQALGVSPVDLLKEDIEIAAVKYSRTTDISIRLSGFLQELQTRDAQFMLDGQELDEDDVQTIIYALESQLDLIKKLVNAKYKA